MRGRWESGPLIAPRIRRTLEDDLARWQRMRAGGLDQTDILDFTVAVSGAGGPPVGDYTIGGRTSRFRFQKNWVPTLIPIHPNPSFLAFTGCTVLGGATAAPVVHFTVDFELADVRSGELIQAFEEDLASTRKIDIYSEGAEDPSDGPNSIFSRVVDSVAGEIASAFP